MLSVRNLHKQFGELRLLQGLDLSLPEQSLWVLIGPNGCGKSTLLNIITGEIRAEAGDVTLCGQSIMRKSPQQIANLGILRKFQTPGVFASLTVREHLALPSMLRKRKHKPAQIEQMARQMQLSDLLDQSVSSLSTGQLQWLEMAMLLLMQPKLLLLDEPVSGMTHDEMLTTVTLLQSLQSQGLTVLIIEHNMTFVKKLDAEITVLMDGKAHVTGDFTCISADDKVQENYLGTLYT